MECREAIDLMFNQDRDDPMTLGQHLRLSLHLLVCGECAEKEKKIDLLNDVFHADFFPPAPGIADSVMARIARAEALEDFSEAEEGPGGFSLRGWVIAGCFMFISLATVFFGIDFMKIARLGGPQFLLAIGITIGVVITSYGALFIGSHLKEFSLRFNGLFSEHFKLP